MTRGGSRIRNALCTSPPRLWTAAVHYLLRTEKYAFTRAKHYKTTVLWILKTYDDVCSGALVHLYFEIVEHRSIGGRIAITATEKAGKLLY